MDLLSREEEMGFETANVDAQSEFARTKTPKLTQTTRVSSLEACNHRGDPRRLTRVTF